MTATSAKLQSRSASISGLKDYISGMIRYAFTLCATLLFLAFPASSDEVKASEIVSCINDANDELETARRDLTYAFIELLSDDDRFQFLDGFSLLHGLPYPGFNWALILDGSSSDWVAYELEDGKDSSERAPPIYVPTEVVEALSECGVAWSGLWEGDFPVVERPQPIRIPAPKVESARIPDNPLSAGGAKLLPPTVWEN